jgi:hypothetical protein
MQAHSSKLYDMIRNVLDGKRARLHARAHAFISTDMDYIRSTGFVYVIIDLHLRLSPLSTKHNAGLPIVYWRKKRSPNTDRSSEYIGCPD